MADKKKKKNNNKNGNSGGKPYKPAAATEKDLDALEEQDSEKTETETAEEAPKKEEKAVPKKAKKPVKKEKKSNFFVRTAKRFGRKMKEVFSELKKVTWPTFPTVLKSTGVVLVVVLFFLVIILGFDSLWTWLYGLLGNNLN
jgi:preprotein translocase subunit SecE